MSKELIKEGQLEGDEEYYKISLNLDPNNANNHLNYGNFLSKRGRKEEAEEQYKLAISFHPNDSDTHRHYGNFLSELGRKEEAEEQYKLVISFHPNDSDTHRHYGNFLSELGRKEEAGEQYKLAIKASTYDISTYLNYGNFLSELGRKEEAEEQYKLARKIKRYKLLDLPLLLAVIIYFVLAFTGLLSTIQIVFIGSIITVFSYFLERKYIHFFNSAGYKSYYYFVLVFMIVIQLIFGDGNEISTTVLIITACVACIEAIDNFYLSRK